MDLVYSGELLLNLQELFSDQPSLLCQKKLICYCSHITIPRGVLAYSCQNPEIFIFFQWVKKLYNSRYFFSVSSKARTV